MLYYIFAGEHYYPLAAPGDLVKSFEADSDVEALKIFDVWREEVYMEWPSSKFKNDFVLIDTPAGKLYNKERDWICLLRADENLTEIAPK